MNKIKNLLFLFALSLMTFPAFSQDSLKIKFKKNIIKVSAITNLSFLTASFGYERYMAQKSSLSLTINRMKAYNEEEGSSGSLSNLIIAYNYNLQSKNRFINNLWISTYFIFRKEKYEEDHQSYKTENYKTENYGLGLCLGKRMYLNKSKRVCFDLGFGMSYNHKIFTEYSSTIYTSNSFISITNHKPINYWLPRPLLMIEYKF